MKTNGHTLLITMWMKHKSMRENVNRPPFRKEWPCHKIEINGKGETLRPEASSGGEAERKGKGLAAL